VSCLDYDIDSFCKNDSSDTELTIEKSSLKLLN